MTEGRFLDPATAGDAGSPASRRDAAPTFDDRLLAEAVRLHELDGAEPVRDDHAARLARRAGGTLEQRIVCRAHLLEPSARLGEALQHCSQAAAAIVLVGLILGAVAGAGAARAALGTSGTAAVNVFLVLLGLLGVQLLMLAVWLVLNAVRPSLLISGSLGGLALALGQRLAAAAHRGPLQLTAVRAIGTVIAHSSIGRWTLGAISHGIWLSFNVGALVVVLMLLSARDYTFVWETTILSDRTYVPLTRALGAAPANLGFVVPTAEQVQASRLGGDGEDPERALDRARRASQAWAGLIVGSLMLYGLVPRTLLVLLSLLLARRAMRRFRLDIDHPGYRRLQPLLMPASRAIAVLATGDGLLGLDGRRIDGQPKPPPRPAGPPAVVGYEIEPPRPWPPPLHGVRWVDLGFVDDRDAATRAIGELRGLAHEPGTVVIVCELTTSPDRGVRRFLEEVVAATAEAPALLLTAGQRLRQRTAAEHVATRVEDWRLLATAAGLGPHRVLELDLDHATSASLARLETLLDPRSSEAAGAGGAEDAKATPGARHLEEAFALIAKHAAGWPAWPGRDEQVRLQVAIAKLYRDGAGRWRQLLRLPHDMPVKNVAAMTGQIRSSAERMVELLPGRLRSSPRWLAAGAVTGALGCVTAAMLLSPVAISALPLWSGLGAAVAAAVRLGASMQGEPEPAEPVRSAEDIDAAARSAALFAVLLELQGGEEAWITRVLEATFPERTDVPMRTVSDVGVWLDETRHRLDLALAQEASS